MNIKEVDSTIVGYNSEAKSLYDEYQTWYTNNNGSNYENLLTLTESETLYNTYKDNSDNYDIANNYINEIRNNVKTWNSTELVATKDVYATYASCTCNVCYSGQRSCTCNSGQTSCECNTGQKDYGCDDQTPCNCNTGQTPCSCHSDQDAEPCPCNTGQKPCTCNTGQANHGCVGHKPCYCNRGQTACPCNTGQKPCTAYGCSSETCYDNCATNGCRHTATCTINGCTHDPCSANGCTSVGDCPTNCSSHTSDCESNSAIIKSNILHKPYPPML